MTTATALGNQAHAALARISELLRRLQTASTQAAHKHRDSITTTAAQVERAVRRWHAARGSAAREAADRQLAGVLGDLIAKAEGHRAWRIAATPPLRRLKSDVDVAARVQDGRVNLAELKALLDDLANVPAVEASQPRRVPAANPGRLKQAAEELSLAAAEAAELHLSSRCRRRNGPPVCHPGRQCNPSQVATRKLCPFPARTSRRR